MDISKVLRFMESIEKSIQRESDLQKLQISESNGAYLWNAQKYAELHALQEKLELLNLLREFIEHGN